MVWALLNSQKWSEAPKQSEMVWEAPKCPEMVWEAPNGGPGGYKVARKGLGSS